MTTNQMTLPVQGMTCASCVRHVERALSGVKAWLGPTPTS